MDGKKIVRKTVGTVALSAGVLCKLSEFGLSVSKIVLCGAKNLANTFAKGPDTKVGESVLGGIQKGAHKAADELFKKAKELYR